MAAWLGAARGLFSLAEVRWRADAADQVRIGGCELSIDEEYERKSAPPVPAHVPTSAQRVRGDAWVPGSGLRSREIDAIKGFLMLLIAFGHNYYLGILWPHFQQFLYNFHVICFLLLVFFLPGRPLSLGFARDRAVRYLVPHYAFVLLACVAYFMMFVTAGAVGDWLSDVGIALLVGSTQALKRACGFQLYWFLPALLTIVCLRALWTREGWVIRGAILLACFAVIVAIPSLPMEVKRYTPLGILPAMVAFPLGVASAELWPRLRASTGIAWCVLPFALWAGCSVAIWRGDLAFRIGSVGLVGGGPLALVPCLLVVVAAMLSILIAAPVLARIPGLVTVGRVSLQFFLIHSLVFSLLRLGVTRLPGTWGSPLVLGFVTLALTVGVSTAWGLLTERSPKLMRLLFPRDLDSWRGRKAA